MLQAVGLQRVRCDLATENNPNYFLERLIFNKLDPHWLGLQHMNFGETQFSIS